MKKIWENNKSKTENNPNVEYGHFPMTRSYDYVGRASDLWGNIHLQEVVNNTCFGEEDTTKWIDNGVLFYTAIVWSDLCETTKIKIQIKPVLSFLNSWYIGGRST